MKKLMRYRLYLMSSPGGEGADYISVESTDEWAAIVERNLQFIRWLGDWQEVEV